MKSLLKKQSLSLGAVLLVGALVFSGCQTPPTTPEDTSLSSAPSSATESPVPPDDSLKETGEKFVLAEFSSAIKSFEESYPDAVITQLKTQIVGDENIIFLEGLDLQTEYDLEYDTQGHLLREKNEPADQEAAQEMEYEGFTSQDISTLLSTEEALSAATEQRNGKVKSLSLSKEKGEFYYEVEVLDTGRRWEITLKAQDGTVVEIDD